MTKKNLTFRVNGQTITRTDNTQVVANSVNYLYASFDFSEAWDGVAAMAIFTTNKGKPYSVGIIDGECAVPWEVLCDTSFLVGCVGGDVITTDTVRVPVNMSVNTTDPAVAPTPSAYQQLVKQVEGVSDRLPYIGEDKRWYVWDSKVGGYINTGVNAEGKPGTGTGDMEAKTYDPSGRRTDVYNYADQKLREHNEDEDAHAALFEDAAQALGEHIADSVKHITSEERDEWNRVKDATEIPISDTTAAALGMENGASVDEAVAQVGGSVSANVDITAYGESTFSITHTLNCICFGNGRFVGLVSGSAVGAYSDDAVNWLPIALPVSASWQWIAYGADKFVAIAAGCCIYSEDGINWAQATDYTETQTPVKLYYANGQFWAPSGAVSGWSMWHSVNGVTWVETAMTGFTNDVSAKDAVYGNGRHVIVGTGSNYMASYSTNGFAWTNVANLSSGISDPYAVAYGNGVFAAVGSNKTAMYSTNGANWTATTTPVSNTSNNREMIFDNGMFIQTEGGSKTGHYSTDGKTWTSMTFSNSVPITSNAASTAAAKGAFGNGKFVFVVKQALVMTSTDGITWADSPLTAAPTEWENYTRTTSHHVLASGKYIATSTDGKTWTQSAALGAGEISDLTNQKNSTTVVAAVGNGDTVRYGTNALNNSITLPQVADWALVESPDSDTGVVVARNSDLLAYGSLSTTATWTLVTLPVVADWQSIQWEYSKYFIFAKNSDFICRFTGNAASKIALPAVADWVHIACDGLRWVAVARNSDIAAYSDDGGSHWTQTKLPVSQSWDFVVSQNNAFAAFANGSTTYAYSLDGITWYAGTLPTAPDWIDLHDDFGVITVARANGNLEDINLEISAANARGYVYAHESLVFETGTYVGTGATSKSLTFDFVPLVVYVRSSSEVIHMTTTDEMKPYGSVSSYVYHATSSNQKITHGMHGNKVDWLADSATYALNKADTTYQYLALGVRKGGA